MSQGVQSALKVGLLLLGMVTLAGCPLFGGRRRPRPLHWARLRLHHDFRLLPGQVCSSARICVDGCRTDGDCSQGFACGSDSQCVATNVCTSSATCGSDVCDFRGTCVTPEAGSCFADSDCDGDDVCVDGFCRARAAVCQFNSDCGADRACVNNRCSAICGTGGTVCAAGETCISGLCRPADPACATSEDCPSDQNCVAGQCYADCADTGSCSEANTLCGDDDFCRPDIFPKPFCGNDEDCAPGVVCRDGVCRTPCPGGTDTECQTADFQLPICGPQMLCLSTNEATPDCFRQGDCSTGESCIDGQCR